MSQGPPQQAKSSPAAKGPPARKLKRAIAPSPRRLVIDLILVLVVLAAFLAIDLTQAAREQIVSQFTTLQTRQVQRMAQELEVYLRDCSQGLQALATSPHLQDRDWARFQTEIEAHVKTGWARDSLRIGVFDEKGTMVWSSTTNTFSEDGAGAELVKWARKKENRGKTQVWYWRDGDPEPGPGLPVPGRLFLATPVYSPLLSTSTFRGPSVRGGVLVMALDLGPALSEHSPFFNHPLAEASRFWLMSQDGTLLLQNDHPDMVGKNVRHPRARCQECHTSFAHAEKMTLALSGTMEYQLKDRPTQLAAFAPIKFENAPWVLVMHASRDTVTGFLRHGIKELLLVVASLVGALGLATGLAYHAHTSRVRAEAEAKQWQEKHQLEERIRQAEACYRTLFEQSPDGILIVDPETTLPIEFNDMAHRQLGYSREEFARLRLSDYGDLTAPEGPDSYLEEASRAGRARFEAQHRTKQGDLREVEVIMQCLNLPERPVLYCIHHDITQRKHAERRVRDAEALYHSLVENLPQNIIRKDAQGRFTFANEQFCQSLGQPLEKILGKTDAELFPAELAAIYQQDDRQVMVTGETLDKTEAHQTPDGKRLFVQLVKTPLYDPDGKVTGVQCIFWDVTESKRAAERMEEMHRQLLDTSRQAGMAEVATGVLHNVGNVLNSVNVSATLVVDRLQKLKLSNLIKATDLLQAHTADADDFLNQDPKGRQLPDYLASMAKFLAEEQSLWIRELETLRTNLDHIKDIVSMQQNYARVAGVVESVPLCELIEDAVRLNAGALARHRVAVRREYGEMPNISVDKHKVLQILVNLIRNAKYALDEGNPADKVLTLRSRWDGNGHVTIEVSDNGVGIPPENLTRIFAHGFTTRANGHGFGLHASALAARELGGSLRGQSEGTGQGATFTLQIPMHPPATS